MVSTCAIIIKTLPKISNLGTFDHSELFMSHVRVSKKCDFPINIHLVLLVLTLKQL